MPFRLFCPLRLDADEWTALSSLADDTDQSKSTVVRHVNDLADVGLVETRMDGKTKLVTPTLAGTLLDASLTL